jgi:hypothetical protein
MEVLIWLQSELSITISRISEPTSRVIEDRGISRWTLSLMKVKEELLPGIKTANQGTN